MVTKTISLPDPLWQAIGRRVRRDGCRDESEYFAKLVEADLNRQKLEAWNRLTDDMDKGMANPLTAPLSEGELDDLVQGAEAVVAKQSSSASGA